MSTRYEPPRRRSRDAGILLLLLVLLAGIGVLALDPFRPAVAITGSAARWTPADATRAYATSTAQGPADLLTGTAQAMVEHSRLAPLEAPEGISPTAYRLIPGPQRRPAQWWRETLFVAGAGAAWRHRLRALEGDGTIRRTVQTWGPWGLLFAPGLVELPATVTAGDRWSSEGEFAGDEKLGIGRYHNDSSATADKDGCLRVVSETRLTAENGTPYRWREQNTWCPDRGVVAEQGSTDLPGRALDWQLGPGTPPSARPVADFTPAPVPVSELPRWTRHQMVPVRGDDTFGHDRSRDGTQSGMGAVTTDGVGVLVGLGTPDLIALEATGKGLTMAAITRFRPGGAAVHVTAVAGFVAISTSERELQLRRPGGYLVWTARLPDVSSTRAVRVGDDRLVVATMGGSVHCLELGTGRELWRHQLPAGVTVNPVSDGTVVAVADEQRNVTVLDADTGSERWQADHPFPVQAVALGPGRLFTATAGQLTATSLDSNDLLWQTTIPGVEHLTLTADRVVVPGRDQTQLRNAADGALISAVAGHGTQNDRSTEPTTLAVGDTVFVLAGDRLLALGPDGRQRGLWPVSPSTRPRSLHPSRAGVWVLGHDAGGWTLDGIGS
ncbi:PQQ-binding-like beta-propeller repeat protein [Naumannella sp. ID2617S]|nr:PQQ-binding-like beta-propeller repeat protein [Naumannella sp. ID2617S]